MPSWCNAVGVVLLIAQGWRGTSLPWVSIRKGFNAVSVEFSLRRHGYSEEIYGGLRRKSSTPTALVHAQHTLSQGSLHYRLATLGYRKRNTYGVGMFIL